jgi:hypothetical protein
MGAVLGLTTRSSPCLSANRTAVSAAAVPSGLHVQFDLGECD